MSASPDPYTVLGVTPGATPAQISHAFRTRLRALHPDTGAADGPLPADAEAQLRQLLGAYDALRHRGRRSSPDPAVSTRRNPEPQAPVSVPVTYRRPPARPRREGLWAGPVRRHR